ncbi:hypothetical protein GCM10022265_19240 [Marinobacter xestospongiae]
MGRAGDKRRIRPSIALQKCCPHLRPDLECIRTNGWSKPCHELCRRAAHRRNRLLDHPGAQSPPARMRGGNTGTGTITQQYRQTIRGEDAANQTWLRSDTGIGRHTGRYRQPNDLGTMNLP